MNWWDRLTAMCSVIKFFRKSPISKLENWHSQIGPRWGGGGGGHVTMTLTFDLLTPKSIGVFLSLSSICVWSMKSVGRTLFELSRYNEVWTDGRTDRQTDKVITIGLPHLRWRGPNYVILCYFKQSCKWNVKSLSLNVGCSILQLTEYYYTLYLISMRIFEQIWKISEQHRYKTQRISLYIIKLSDIHVSIKPVFRRMHVAPAKQNLTGRQRTKCTRDPLKWRFASLAL